MALEFFERSSTAPGVPIIKVSWWVLKLNTLIQQCNHWYDRTHGVIWISTIWQCNVVLLPSTETKNLSLKPSTISTLKNSMLLLSAAGSCMPNPRLSHYLDELLGRWLSTMMQSKPRRLVEFTGAAMLKKNWKVNKAHNKLQIGLCHLKKHGVESIQNLSWYPNVARGWVQAPNKWTALMLSTSIWTSRLHTCSSNHCLLSVARLSSCYTP